MLRSIAFRAKVNEDNVETRLDWKELERIVVDEMGLKKLRVFEISSSNSLVDKFISFGQAQVADARLAAQSDFLISRRRLRLVTRS